MEVEKNKCLRYFMPIFLSHCGLVRKEGVVTQGNSHVTAIKRLKSVNDNKHESRPMQQHVTAQDFWHCCQLIQFVGRNSGKDKYGGHVAHVQLRRVDPNFSLPIEIFLKQAHQFYDLQRYEKI